MIVSRFIQKLIRTSLILALFLALDSYKELRSDFHLPFALSSNLQPDPQEVRSVKEVRGVWVQAKAITNQEKIDQLLQRAEEAHFNTIFAGVTYKGQASLENELARENELAQSNFDPLAYLVLQAQRRKMEVHAWFSVGKIEDKNTSPILMEHPEWGLVGPDGNTTGWLNFNRPDVRQFLTEMILDTIIRYGVDGVHLDYTRYPGPEWGFDPYSIEVFNQEYEIDLNELRFSELPAYGTFEGNPLSSPGPAQILATFSNGLPAVTLNRYGQGEVILLNWNASKRNIAAGTEIMQRTLQRLVDGGGQVFLLRSETNAEVYGYRGFETVMDWLADIGWVITEVKESDVMRLAPGSTLIMPHIYVISPDMAVELANYVNRGGGIVFIDGPVRSIHLTDIQAITGMQGRSEYFKETMLLLPNGEHLLIPTGQRVVDLETYQVWDEQWKGFRRQGINTFIKDAYRSVKEKFPEIMVSVTITSNQDEAADKYFQDWPSWLLAGYIDLLIPRAYVEEVQHLQPVLEAWQPVIRDDDRIIFGLITFVDKDGSVIVKSSDQLLAEMFILKASGSNGVVLFHLDEVNDEQIEGLAFAFSLFPSENLEGKFNQ